MVYYINKNIYTLHIDKLFLGLIYKLIKLLIYLEGDDFLVSSNSMLFMILTFLVSTILPISLVIFFYKKEKISLKVVLIAAIAFFISTQILEASIHKVVLVNNKTTAEFFENPWFYMLYAGFMSGIFEEVSRYLMFKFVLKNNRQWKDGLAYGLGHGSIEAMLLVGVTFFNNIIMAFQINSGNFQKLLQLENAPVDVLNEIYIRMVNLPSYIWGIASIERICTMIIQVGLSLIVLYAVRERKVIYLFLAILIHAIVDFLPALHQVGAIQSIAIVEEFLIILTALMLIFIMKSKKIFKNAGISN